MATRTRKGRKSFKELFLTELKKQSGADSVLVSNNSVREALGWEPERYNAVKDQLRSENLIMVGQGRGGSVAPVMVPSSTLLNVFISYSHADESLKNELVKHLLPLQRMSLVNTWHDRKIMPGTEWDREISKNLSSADIIILLVSIDFINSKYCYDIELEEALEKHRNNEARVIPVIARACLWSHTPFSRLQALPRDAKPVSSFVDRDSAFADIAEGIRATAEELLAQR